jgi:hypothetical protein
LLVSGFTLSFSEITVHLEKLTTAQFAKNGPSLCEGPRIIIMPIRVESEKKRKKKEEEKKIPARYD